ncbi:GNAT family N-acetyltransferase [Polynucleobacter sp. TSB-Sco08W16]|uniref:GNAT family N-acetyltransferase n=1 Tax=Polynucleobacter sp. TSB-Sco08W16 TaxID=1758374 RepID=UPI001BFE1F2A|nr:GNAT family N-acetyltransferase [Polynucleobacter sp. TSB-Sco08W16]QWD74232.1 GNAT family N-acetyltransferase [Polynucleobacter sp. TSB-Sco08W16]
MIQFRDDANITAEQAIDLYIRSTLGERRPIHNKETFEAMLKNANLTITAWDENTLVGIARTLTDFAYVAYLADLAVDQQYQHSGIGKQLIANTQSRLGPECMIVLLAAPKANEYYEHIGFEHNPRAWTLKK